MSSVVCGNRGCMWNKGQFCGKEFVFLNNGLQCRTWFDDNGQVRQYPHYSLEPKPIDASEQPFPQYNDEKVEEKNEQDR